MLGLELADEVLLSFQSLKIKVHCLIFLTSLQWLAKSSQCLVCPYLALRHFLMHGRLGRFCGTTLLGEVGRVLEQESDEPLVHTMCMRA